MAKVLIGNFKGPKGNDGQKGNKGEKGETGQRGSRWSEGTAITGTSTTATIFSGSGITDALVNDVYLNTSTGNVYRCTVAGAAAAAKWVYVGCIKGAKGNDGKTPTVVDDMTVAFTQASSRANIATGEKMSTIMGKIKKFFADLTAPAFAQMITTKDDLLATKKTGYVPDAKAVADAVTDVTSNFIMSEAVAVKTQNIKAGNIVFIKLGKLVICPISACATNGIKSYTTIATIPEGYRPMYDTVIICKLINIDNNAYILNMEANGNITTRSDIPDDWLVGTACWFTN